MAGFSSAGFSSAGFSAADINSAVSRVTSESLGGWVEGLVLRYTAESLSAPVLWRVVSSRVTAEVMAENIPRTLRAYREVAEVLHENLYALPSGELAVRRVTAEVLGLAASTAGKEASVRRMVAEALMSVQTRSTGLQMPSVSLDAVSVYMAVTLNTAEGPGYLGFRDENGDGFSLTWAGGDDQVTKTWTHGASSASSTFTYPGGITIVDFRAAGTGTPALMTDFGTLKPEGNQASGQVHELLLFNTSVSGTKDANYRAYLTCKWITDGCTDLQTPCDEPPPPEPGEHFYTIVSGDYAGVYVGYVSPALGGEETGTVEPNDGYLVGLIASNDGTVVQVILGLETPEPLTEATITVNGIPYNQAGVVAPGVDYGMPFPYIFLVAGAADIPGWIVGSTVTVDVH